MQRRKLMFAGLGAMALLPAWRLACGDPLPGTIARSEALPSGQRLYRGADLAFGTTVSIQLVMDDGPRAERAIADAFACAKSIDSLMSIYSEASQVHALNRYGRIERPHPHLLEVLKVSRKLAEMTDGAFDVTVQPLWAASMGRADRRQARELVSWRDLVFDTRKVELRRPGMAVTLNGIAQGYATDIALAALREHGVRQALLDIGEFRNAGRRSAARPWVVGIQDPRRRDSIIGSVGMDGRGVATSGDYETPFTDDFSQHHIWDPHTGYSPVELAGVTVLAPDTTMADGLSTALMVMGMEKGMTLAERLEGVDAVFIDKKGQRRYTKGINWIKV
jgi:thiamine biosynthesis lipoprotein